MFLYCSYAMHCQNGMVAVVNPTADMTLEKYKSTAADSKENKSPEAVFGGTVKDAGGSGGSTSAPATGSQTGSASAPATGSQTGSVSTMPTGTETSPSETGGSKTSGGAQPTKTNGASSAQVGVLAAAAGIAAFIV